MNVQQRNDVSIYCLSSGTALPEWLGDRARRNLSKTNESVRRRVELIQDFAMPAASSKLAQSADGRYIMAAGTYPPRIRCYDVHDLAMKFERYVTADVIDMVLLGSDYGKLALLQADRTIAFHAHYGAHESIRIPSFGRAMAYETTTCELLVPAKGNSVYRINLDEGRFNEPWTVGTTDGASGTCISVHPRHALAAVGCDDGTVRLWDNRSPESIGRPFLNLDVTSAVAGYGYADAHNHTTSEITAIAHDVSGLYMSVGTGGGIVALYDVRSSRPLHVQEHKHGLPIHTVRFHSSSGMVLSADEKLVKVWRYKSAGEASFSTVDAESSATPTEDSTNTSAIGAVRVNIEGNGKLTHFIVAGDENDPNGDRSGLLLCATDQPKMDSFYIPAIGVAPKWCSYLENITEELEERDGTDTDDLVRSGQESVFENYTFVSRDDLEKLGISNLVGTPLLRGYMHGFFMDMNLYNRVKAVANPFEYEEYQKKKLKERLDAKQSSRIAPRATDKKKKPKVAVNPDLAERLENKAIDANTKAGQVAKGLLADDRFGPLFTNPDFEIDQEDEDFKLRNPSGVAAKNKRNNLDSDSEDDDGTVDEGTANIERNDGDDDDDDDDDLDSDAGLEDLHLDDVNDDSDDDGFQGGKVRGEAYEAMKATPSKQKPLHKGRKKVPAPVMYEAEADAAGYSGTAVGSGHGGEPSAATKAQRRRNELNLPLGKRRAMESAEGSARPQVRLHGGSKEAVYVPRDSKRRAAGVGLGSGRDSPAGNGQSGTNKRRGVKDLGFKAPFRHQK